MRLGQDGLYGNGGMGGQVVREGFVYRGRVEERMCERERES